MVMRSITAGLVTTIALLAPAVLSAGQIYGTISAEGKGVKDVAVDIKCGSNEAVSAKTAADGAYRINVPQQGQCTLTLPSYEGKPSAMVFSTPNPSAYNFELVKLADGKFELKRRS
jgi:hypothetical protein